MRKIQIGRKEWSRQRELPADASAANLKKEGKLADQTRELIRSEKQQKRKAVFGGEEEGRKEWEWE